MKNLKDLLTIVIPHHGGKEMLLDCLFSIQNVSSELPTLFLIDNHSPDDSVQIAISRFPWIEVIYSNKNLGYAGGCNLGISHTKTPYVLLLNNDVVFVQKDCLQMLVEAINKSIKIAAVQPMIKSFQEQQFFDYAGAAGGLLDRDGIPFAYGRILNTIERDQGQYNTIHHIFWASGTAAMFRMDALYEVGFLYEPFFAHQEEIDLCWRLLAKGWEIIAVPQVTIFHRGGSTLNRASNFKLYLNHRNNLWMWIRNKDDFNLLTIGRRLTLEFLAFLAYLFRGDFGRVLYQIKAWVDFLKRLPIVYKERKLIQFHRTMPDSQLKGMYQGSVIWQYYFKRHRFTHNFYK
ncbi:MAG: glycosyltransferase family 2 protein [bacterium]|nr:glycosyltransferase family 2 protein [bacterium]